MYIHVCITQEYEYHIAYFSIPFSVPHFNNTYPTTEHNKTQMESGEI